VSKGKGTSAERRKQAKAASVVLEQKKLHAESLAKVTFEDIQKMHYSNLNQDEGNESD